VINAVEQALPLPQVQQYTPRQLNHRGLVPSGLTDLPDVVRQEESRRCEAIRHDINTRLRNACSYMGDEEFAALVDKMVKTQFGGERHRS
jgi:hypothetical protein